ncbi:MAG: HAMP domain-containing sensor histidine kinase [Actinomycetota bacterium]|nr:HAMP domain-containing sensor histidine kinase [Actinomycetota bacterium]
MPRFLRSVRAKAALAAMAVVAVALALASVAILEATFSAVDAAAQNLARNQIASVALIMKGGEVSDPLPVPRGDLGVQVIDATGKVVATTANVAKLDAFANITPATNSLLQNLKLGDHRILGDLKGDSEGVLVGERVSVPADGLRVVHYSTATQADNQPREISEIQVKTSPTPGVGTANATPGSQSVFVLVFASLGTTVQSTRATETSLFVLFPILVILVGLVVWYLTGRALRPVEKIRSEVATISGANLHARVHLPTSRDEIAKLAATMNEMLDRLEQSSERMRAFVSDASHELRSPIASIRAELEVSLLHPEATEMPVALSAALEEAARMQRIVDDLLTLAKIDEKVLVAKTESVDMDEIVATEARRIRAQYGKSVDTTEVQAARILGDRDQIFRVVRNLFDNAARYSRSRVAISLTVLDGTVELRVSDDGPGIPEEMREKVFERFHRVEKDRSRISGGSGLGLAIAASLVELHRGRLYVEEGPSELGGAELVLQLPADPAFSGREPIQPIHTLEA